MNSAEGPRSTKPHCGPRGSEVTAYCRHRPGTPFSSAGPRSGMATGSLGLETRL